MRRTLTSVGVAVCLCLAGVAGVRVLGGEGVVVAPGPQVSKSAPSTEASADAGQPAGGGKKVKAAVKKAKT